MTNSMAPFHWALIEAISKINGRALTLMPLKCSAIDRIYWLIFLLPPSLGKSSTRFYRWMGYFYRRILHSQSAQLASLQKKHETTAMPRQRHALIHSLFNRFRSSHWIVKPWSTCIHHHLNLFHGLFVHLAFSFISGSICTSHRDF